MTLYECAKHPGHFAQGSLETGITERCPACRAMFTAPTAEALRILLKATRLLWGHRMNPAKLRPEVIQGAIEQAEAELRRLDREQWETL